MRKRIKTVLALFLAVSCICSTVVSAVTLAGEPSLKQEDLQKKLLQDGVPAQESKSKQETESAQGSESEQEAESVQGSEFIREAELAEDAFYAEKELSGVLVTVQADSGVFPKGATLRVRKLSQAEEQKVDSTVKEKLQEDKENLLQSIIFDISVLDKDGEEIQPDTTKGEVKVSFSKLSFLEENAEKQISVFHLDSVDAAAEKLETEKIEEEKNAVKVSAEHFSVFAVSLVEKENYFSDTVAVELGERISLYKLLDYAVLRCRVTQDTDPAIVSLMLDAIGHIAIEALHEGTAKLLVTIKMGRWRKQKNTRLLCRKHL